MALDTKPRLFVACAPTGRTTRCKGDAAAGWSTVIGSSSDEIPGSSRSEDHRDTGDDNVTAPAEATSLGTASAGTASGEALSAETVPASADVLVVDDDADVRWSVAEVLRSAGFSVAVADDGEVARAMLITGSYRMVLLDMRMPRRDGVSLIEVVGKVPPVIVHSAYSLDASDRARLGSSVVDYLHKPVPPQKLLRAVEAVLGSKD